MESVSGSMHELSFCWALDFPLATRITFCANDRFCMQLSRTERVIDLFFEIFSGTKSCTSEESSGTSWRLAVSDWSVCVSGRLTGDPLDAHGIDRTYGT